MSIKLTQTEPYSTYFCTFACLNWLHLFELTNLYDEIYKWLNLLHRKGNSVIGFVIMPNHLHVIIHTSGETINKTLANGKRFLAYEIVNRLKSSSQQEILKQLAAAVTPQERARKKKHRVFEISSDIKLCYSRNFLIQKLNYIHDNPVSGKWRLAADFTLYPHSSAGYYELNQEHPKVKITHYDEILDVSSHSGDDIDSEGKDTN